MKKLFYGFVVVSIVCLVFSELNYPLVVAAAAVAGAVGVVHVAVVVAFALGGQSQSLDEPVPHRDRLATDRVRDLSTHDQARVRDRLHDQARVHDRPHVQARVARPSTGPSTGTRPSTRPGTRPSTGGRPTQGQLNNFLDLSGPSTGRPGTRPSTRPSTGPAARAAAGSCREAERQQRS